MRKLVLVCFILFSSSVFAAETKSHDAFAKEGNIYYLQDGKDVQVTTSGKDQAPVLSPDKKMIAFIRTSNQKVPDACDDVESRSEFASQIWLYDIAEKKERLLVDNNFSCDKPEKKIINPKHLQFSPASDVLYFLTPGWVTSSALHAVKSDGTNEHYIVPANSLEVLQEGRYKGGLIVLQHRYFIGGDTFDWYWLFTPEGKEAGTFGSKISKSQREFIMSEG